MGIIVILATVAANVVAALADFTKSRFATETAVEVGVPQTWLPVLGTLKTAGAAGLTLGLTGIPNLGLAAAPYLGLAAAPYLGLAAAVGLVLFFLGAIVVHLRADEFHHIVATVGYLALTTAALGVEIGRSG
jgi:hypothetical protein